MLLRIPSVNAAGRQIVVALFLHSPLRSQE